jgi:hypothetical protein
MIDHIEHDPIQPWGYDTHSVDQAWPKRNLRNILNSQMRLDATRGTAGLSGVTKHRGVIALLIVTAIGILALSYAVVGPRGQHLHCVRLGSHSMTVAEVSEFADQFPLSDQDEADLLECTARGFK